MGSIKSHSYQCSTALHAHHHVQNAHQTQHVNNADHHLFISILHVSQIALLDII